MRSRLSYTAFVFDHRRPCVVLDNVILLPIIALSSPPKFIHHMLNENPIRGDSSLKLEHQNIDLIEKLSLLGFLV